MTLKKYNEYAVYKFVKFDVLSHTQTVARAHRKTHTHAQLSKMSAAAVDVTDNHPVLQLFPPSIPHFTLSQSVVLSSKHLSGSPQYAANIPTLLLHS